MLHVRDTLAMAQEDDTNKNSKTKQQIKELQIQLKVAKMLTVQLATDTLSPFISTLSFRSTLSFTSTSHNPSTPPSLSSTPRSSQIVERHLDQTLSHWRAKLGLEHLKLPTGGGGGGGGGGVSGLINSEPEVKPVVLRKRRQRVKSEANWPLFYYQFNCDHAKPNLIWNRKVCLE